jgi:hypothetical protein
MHARPFPHVAIPHTALHIFTFKHGLLSRLAHDLRISVPRFDVELRAGHVRARFDVESARVDGVVVGERVDANKFSRQDTQGIERNMRDFVLHAERFPSVDFEGEVEEATPGWTVRGRLTMMGRTCELAVPVIRDGSDLVVELDLKPSLWGIPPFTTMGGAIGIEDRWRVHLKLALGVLAPERLLHRDAVTRWGG